MGTTLNVRRASIANPPSDSQMSQAVCPTPPPSNNPTVRVGSAPLPNQNPSIRLPPPLNAFNESIRNASHSTQVMPNSDSSRNHISQQTTISPNDTLINPHPTLLAPTPMPANVSTTMPASTLPMTYTSNTGQSFQRTEPITATAASMPPTVRSDTDALHSNASSPILPSRTMGLKRESMSMDIDVPNGSNKKPRVQSPGIDLNTPPPPSPSVPPPSALSELSMSEAPSAVPDGQAVVEEDDDDEVVEVGPDGLRLVEDILEQVYGENRRGEVVCWFCQ
ncbi:hypothetical protein BDN70DRAFT_65412 [Pholiota conissans]|uniref:Uncharacterized protein n=1 Tax=Pholiota conissans TaxID=109636 RepID=A0A9P5YZ55_9AGAR|nr:hypothetical protein BDN70DRAFT_65412 [Pholiota conissans]